MAHNLTSTARRRTFLSRAVGFFLAAPSGAWAEDVVFRTGVNHVLLDVSVTDSKGQPVSNLKREQFQVSDNHSRREITTFATGDVDISVAIIVDNSRSMRPRQEAVLRGLQALVSDLQKGDDAGMLLFGDRVNFAIQFQNKPSWNLWRETLLRDRPDGRTSLYDAVLRGIHLLESSAHERRVIILLSDGQDTASRASLSEVVNGLRSSNTLLYAVGLFDSSDPDSSSEVLRKMAGDYRRPTDRGCGWHSLDRILCSHFQGPSVSLPHRLQFRRCRFGKRRDSAAFCQSYESPARTSAYPRPEGVPHCAQVTKQSPKGM
jgi:von Willebrand factor type A domain